MRKSILLIATVCVTAVINFASADIIREINLDFVTIGNAGNAADTGGTPGCGAVGYNYRIGKYEVTNAQWNAFTLAAGAPTGNPSGAYDQSAYYTGDQQPTDYVSWYEAAQFCNYLTSGDKSLGAYQLGTDGSITIDRASAISTYSMVYVIPTEDEWYKAAYYKPDGSGYSPYANGTDVAPIAGVETNYYMVIGHPWNVGTGKQEQNGTYDMMGNSWEWNEAWADSYGVMRGGQYSHCFSDYLRSTHRLLYTPTDEDEGLGFRVASIPEPATLLLLGLGGLMLQKHRRQ